MNATTLNISAQSIKILAVHGKTVKRQEIILPPGAIRNGLILQPEAVGLQLKTMVKSGKFPTGRMICTVNGLPFSYRLLTVPAMEASAFSEAVLRTARKEMSISPDEMYLSWQAFPAAGDEWHVFVAGITRHPVDNLIKALTAAGIEPWLLDLPHLALARMSRHQDAVIVDFEKDCSNIVLLADGVPRGMHMIPALGTAASLQDQVGQVTDKLAKMIDFYNSGHPVKPIKEPANIIVTGELLEDTNTLEYIRQQTGCPVELLASSDPSLADIPLHLYAVNAGSGLINACLEKAAGKDAAPCRCLSLEKIVRERRPRTNIPGVLKKALVPLLLVGSISFLTVSVLTQMNLQSNVDSLQAKLDASNAELTQRQVLAAGANKLEGDIEEISTKVEDIKAGQLEIFSSRNYVNDISSIVACMPPGLTFSKMGVNYREISLEGVSNSASPVVTFADALETAGGFSQAIIHWIERPHGMADGGPVLSFRIVITRAVD